MTERTAPSPAIPHHRFRIDGRHGPLLFRVHAALSAPWTVLFGPSGSGKSTVLRALAGLVPQLQTTFTRYPPGGRTQALQDEHIHLAPESRALAFDPQQALLLPHLSVAENIRFPEAVRNLAPAATQTAEIIRLLDLESLASKRPQQLSGGERQRVSLARALAVPGARLLLLDEPFAGLDRSFRDQLLPGLRAFLRARQLPVLSVTHDVDEALLLGADVLRLSDGCLQAQGPAHIVLADEVRRLQAILQATP